ncbi:MAG: hypothetical protein IPK24_20345 [Kineosporiaceae bacterium]|nr:hypothetical protein [Kineosporiaceae bacterium]MBK8077838.1 hypothetical protein [Kineosporiaceae bacterium]
MTMPGHTDAHPLRRRGGHLVTAAAAAVAVSIGVCGAASPPSAAASPVSAAAAPVPNVCGYDHKPGWIARENAKKSGRVAVLPVGYRYATSTAAYLSSPSATCSDTLSLYVSTKAPSYTVQIVRTGYYGGKGARIVYTSGKHRGVYRGGGKIVNRTTYTALAGWSRDMAIKIDRHWTPGDYLVRVLASDKSFSFVPFTIVDRSSVAPIQVVNAVMTWQAYNLWGGASLYATNQRSRSDPGYAVTFARPYLGDGKRRFGDGVFIEQEFPFVNLGGRHRAGPDLCHGHRHRQGPETAAAFQGQCLAHTRRILDERDA